MPVITRRDFVRGTLGSVAAGSALAPSRRGLRGAPAAPAPFRAGRRRSRRARPERRARRRPRGPRPDAGGHRDAADGPEDAEGGVARALQAWRHGRPRFHAAPQPHAPELVEAVRKALVDAGIPGGQIREAQGGIEKPRACTALVALPALKAHWLTGLARDEALHHVLGPPEPVSRGREREPRETWLAARRQGKDEAGAGGRAAALCDKGPQPDRGTCGTTRGSSPAPTPVAVDAVGLQIVMAKRKACAARTGRCRRRRCACRCRREVRPGHEPDERDRAGPRGLDAGRLV